MSQKKHLIQAGEFISAGGPRGLVFAVCAAHCLLMTSVGSASEFENFQVESITIESGVTAEIRALHLDSRGFLWIGTNIGLRKYDGKEFHPYEKTPGKAYSLSNNTVNVIFEDRAGRLWIGTKDGLNLLDRVNNRFKRFVHDAEQPESIRKGEIFGITEDEKGQLWVTTKFGLDKLDKETGAFEHLTADPKKYYALKGQFPYGAFSDSQERIWVSTELGLNLMDPKSNSFTLIKPPMEPNRNGKYGQIYMSPIDRDRFWVFIRYRPFIFDTASQEFIDPFKDLEKAPNLQEMYCHVGLIDRDGGYWIGSFTGGLFHIDPKTQEVQVFNSKTVNWDVNVVMSLMEDRAGNIWVGTFTGLSKIRKTRAGFDFVMVNENARRGMSGQVNHNLVDSKGRVWAAAYSGVYRGEAETLTFDKHYKSDDADPSSLSSVEALRLFEDSQGRIWIGTYYGLNLYQPESDSFKTFLPGKGKNDLKMKAVSQIAEDKKGYLWLGSEMGLTLFDPNKEKFWLFEHDKENPKSLSGNMVSAVYVDRKGMVWVGTDSGLNLFNRKEETFWRFTHNPKDKKSLSDNTVNAIYEDKDGVLWIATNSGLNRYNPETESFTSFYKENNLPSNTIYAVAGDREGRLWLSHPKGITRFSPKNEGAINYDMKDGLRNKFISGAFHQSPSGDIYFGGLVGFNRIQPDKVDYNKHQPNVAPTFLWAKGLGERFEGDLAQEKHLTFSYGSNTFEMGFAALDFTAPEKNLYSYKLEGYTDDWSVPSRKNWFKANNLPPGDYTLRMAAANSDGVWNKEGYSVGITVVPPFWQTTWAYLFYAIAGPGLLFGLYRLRVRQLKARERELQGLVDERTKSLREEKEKTEAQARKLEELDKLKTQFFSNVSHEFRTPLTLIIGPLESMLSGYYGDNKEKLREQQQVMLRNARRLLRLINQLLDISKLEAGKMQLKAGVGDLVKFVKRVVYAFSSLADKENIKLELIAPDENLDVWFDPEKLEKVVFNLISNAFQFTPPGGAITVYVHQVQDEAGRTVAQLAVSDTGVGIPKSDLPRIFDRFRQVDGSTTREHEGTGIGLSLVQELVQLHGGDVDVQSEVGQGTKFSVNLPLGNDHLTAAQIDERQLDSRNFLTSENAKLEMANLEPALIQTDEDLEVGERGGETILIVDDNPDIRNYIRSSFSRRYNVLEAVDGQQGYDTIRKHKPDLIISDVMMPRMDGYEMCRAVKSDKDTRHIPIILLTAKASDDMKVEGLEIGADDYLSKPFNVRELLARVRNMLHMRSQERAMKESLEMAHKVQVSMLPAALPNINGLDIATFSKPAREVGGDYYDFFTRESDKLGVVIGDVSGKGLPAALYMTLAKGLVQVYSGNYESPRAALANINKQFLQAAAPNIFMSLIYAIIDPKTRKMIFSCAGHNPMILRSPANGNTRILGAGGMAIGLDHTVFDRVVDEKQISFQPGDTLVMYTDGITEGMNDRNEVFGEERLIEIIEKGEGLSANELLTQIRGEHQSFTGNAEQFDDITAVVIKIPQAA